MAEEIEEKPSLRGRVESIVKDYCDEMGVEPEIAIRDVITDLMHLHPEAPFYDLLERAQILYREEISEEIHNVDEAENLERGNKGVRV